MRRLTMFLTLIAILALAYSAPVPVNAQDCLPSRLTPGGFGRVLEGSANRLRTQTNTDSQQVGQIPGGATFRVAEEDARCRDGILWRRVVYAGISGWTAEATDVYFVEPLDLPPATPTRIGTQGATSVCESARTPRLFVGALGRTESNTPSRIRNGPGVNETQIAQLDPVDTFSVIAGPICADGFNWWQIRVGPTEGWIAEGNDSDYFVQPLPSTATPRPSRTPLPTRTPTLTRTPTITFTPSVTPTVTITPSPTPSGFTAAKSLAWSPDGSLLAISGDEGLYFYDMRDFDPATFNDTPQFFSDDSAKEIAFNPADPTMMAITVLDFQTLEADFFYRVYDIENSDIIYELEWEPYEGPSGGPSIVRSLAFSADGAQFGYADHKARIVDTETWTESFAYCEATLLQGVLEFDRAQFQAAFNPDFSLIAGAVNRRWVRLIDPAHEYETKGDCAIVPVSTVNGRSVAHFDDADGEVGSTLDRSIRDQYITAITFSPDGNFVIIGDETGSLQMWDVVSGERLSFIRGEPSPTSNRINALAFHPNGLFVATAESEPTGIIRVFSADDLAVVNTYGEGIATTAATAVAYSPDGAYLAALIDGYVHILETEDYTLVARLVRAR